MGARSRRVVLGLLSCAVCLPLAASLRPVGLRAETRQRVLYTSVLDRSSRPVPGLGPADFVVREDGAAREVLSVEPATDPMQVALLVDTSQAAQPYTGELRRAVTAFITELTASPAVKHQIALITVGGRPTIITEYTSSAQSLLAGALRIFPVGGSGSYLLDGIIQASDGLAARHAARPVVVALATDGSELSDLTYPQVLERLTASHAAFHAVIIGHPIAEPIDLATVLDRGTAMTGGRYDTVLSAPALSVRMQRLATELTHQYRVTYAHPDSLIPPDHVTIKTPRAGLDVRGTLLVADGDRTAR